MLDITKISKLNDATNDQDDNVTAGEVRAERRRFKYNEQSNAALKEVRSIVGNFPPPDETLTILSNRRGINSWAFVQALLEDYGEIEELNIFAYRFNRFAIQDLIEMIEQGRIKYTRIVVSSYFRENKKAELWAVELEQYFDYNPQYGETVFQLSHAKVLAAKIMGGGLLHC